MLRKIEKKIAKNFLPSDEYQEYLTNTNRRELCAAAKKGDNRKVIELIAQKVDLDNHNGMPALMLAIENGHIDTVKILLNAGADINQKADEGQDNFPSLLQLSSLLVASGFGHADIISELLSRGVNIEDNNNFAKCTALMAAALFNNLDAVKVLLKAGANKEAVLGSPGTMVLHAYDKKSLKITKGSEELKIREGDTPLIIATYNGYKEIVRILVAAGANKKAVNKRKQTALSIAEKRRNREIINILQLENADSLKNIITNFIKENQKKVGEKLPASPIDNAFFENARPLLKLQGITKKTAPDLFAHLKKKEKEHRLTIFKSWREKEKEYIAAIDQLEREKEQLQRDIDELRQKSGEQSNTKCSV